MADVCPSAERGALLGPTQGAANLAVCLGPAIGGWIALGIGGFRLDILGTGNIWHYGFLCCGTCAARDDEECGWEWNRGGNWVGQNLVVIDQGLLRAKGA